MKTRRMTMAQALIQFLKQQYVERDGREHAFFAGMLGIFGHGNVAGIGQALQQNPDFHYILVRNEQAGVHMAAGFAKASNRLRAFACTSSIGPGATNMITGAALATINRLPVLLLPGDIFARRNVAPVLQQIGVAGHAGHRRERLLQAGVALLGPHLPAGATDHGAAGSDARAHVAVRLRRGDAGAAAGCADRSVRLSRGVVQKRVWLIRRGEPDAVSLARAVEAIAAPSAR